MEGGVVGTDAISRVLSLRVRKPEPGTPGPYYTMLEELVISGI